MMQEQNYTDNILFEINQKFDIILNKIDNLENKINNLHNKFYDLNQKIDSDVIIECKKMGSHINFVENVYDNVKQPLGYISNKVKSLINKNDNYSLTDSTSYITTENID